MKVKLDKWANMPTKAHEADGGWDLYAVKGQVVKARDSAVFDTGVHMQIPVGYAGLMVSKSGLNFDHDIVTTGLIDARYTGSIKVKMYNKGDKDYTVMPGDKISQIMVVPILNEKLEPVDFLEETERGDGGFGSTGR